MGGGWSRSAGSSRRSIIGPAAADLLAAQHEPEDQRRDPGGFSLWPCEPTLANYAVIFSDPAWYMGYVNR